MRPSESESSSQRHERDQDHQWSQEIPMLSTSSPNTKRTRTEESWVDISSLPSSTSISSTSGLNSHDTNGHLSRQHRPKTKPYADPARSTSTFGSSQDEYEESESESDHIMGSSNEDLSQQSPHGADNRTTLGVVSSEDIFTPQPNAFSHPPSQNPSTQVSYFSGSKNMANCAATRSSDHTTIQQSFQQQSDIRDRANHGSYQPDHDAALRASLTTLLSCAAAVRPKSIERNVTTHLSVQPTSLRLIPESELSSPKIRTSPAKQRKRKSRESSKERHAKKIKETKINTLNDESISPTLTTWVISAGVVLVFSAISFSAGYAWGKEVGRIEGEMGISVGTCSKEAMKGSGLRRLRWTSASAVRA